MAGKASGYSLIGGAQARFTRRAEDVRVLDPTKNLARNYTPMEWASGKAYGRGKFAMTAYCTVMPTVVVACMDPLVPVTVML